MNNLLASIHTHVDSFDAIEVATGPLRPVRIAILDSGFDPSNPLLRTDEGQIDPRIKDARSFVHQTNPHQFHDEMGHGTHALGLLLKVATCAEIYVAKVAGRETIDRDSYDDIAKVSLFLRRQNGFETPTNYSSRLSITQSPNGTWTSSRCRSEFGR